MQSVERAVSLLEAVADGPPEGVSLSDLAWGCGLNRATAWRLLSTLEAYGLVQGHGEPHRYRLGLAAVRIASSAALGGAGWGAQAVLRRLSDETGETANLAVSRPAGLTYIAEAVSTSVLAASWLGRTIPLHATSSGKALLAWLPAPEFERLVAEPLARYTEMTITTRSALAVELAAVRTAGYAVCRGELEPTLYGVSAPVLDGQERPFAVVSIWGPKSRVPESRFVELGASVRAAANEIGAAALWYTTRAETPVRRDGDDIGATGPAPPDPS